MTTPKTLARPEQSASQKAVSAPVRSLNLAYDEKLDHLRFLAAFIIIVFHTFPPIYSVLAQVTCDWHVILNHLTALTGAWILPKALVAEGHTAVGLFLTISGFLFAKITSRSDIITHKFYLNRLLRIYPLYMCVIFLALYLSPGPNPFQSLCLSVLTFQNLPQAVSHSMLTPHLWSVAVEFQIYLLFPVFLASYRTQGLRALWLFVAASVGLKAAAYLLAGEVHNLAYVTTFGRVDQFLIGSILGFSFESYRHKIRHPVFLLLSFAVVACVISVFHTQGGSLYTARKSIWIVWPAIEALVWGLFLASYCASSLSLPLILSRFISFLGGIGYSLYVTHFAVSVIVTQRICPHVYNLNQQVLVPLFGASQQEHFIVAVLYAALIVVPATALVSCLTYYGIEKPFMNLRVKYTIPRTSPD